MKRYQINQIEYDYIRDMLTYLDSKENEISAQGRERMKDVLGRIVSRPVLDIIIDKSVLDYADEQQFIEENLKMKNQANVEEYLALVKSDEAASIAYLAEHFSGNDEAGRAFLEEAVEITNAEVASNDEATVSEDTSEG